MQTQESRPRGLWALVAALFGAIVVFHLANALAGRPFIRAVHLGTALQYAQGSIDLLHPVIRGGNAEGTAAALEFPLWQAAAALAFKAAHSTWYGWANLVSLLLFGTAIWPFYQLGRHYAGERATVWATAFLLAQPIVIVMSGEASPDGLSLVALLWFLYFADRMIRSGAARWWLPTVCFGALSAVTKPPFFMTAGWCGIGLILLNGAKAWKPWLLLATAGATGAAVFFAWTRYNDSLWARALYPCVEMRMGRNPDVANWYFGTWHYRLSPGPWLKAVWRFLHATLGSPPLAALAVMALLRPGNRLPKLWLGAMLLTTLVFTHLVLDHWHYYLMCGPAVALLCGATVVRWEGFWAREMPRASLRLALAGLVLAGSAVDGALAMKIGINYDSYRREMGDIIRQHTQPGDRVIVYGGDWGAEELIRADRQGLSVLTLETPKGVDTAKGLYDLLGDEARLQKLKSLGYNKLALMSESPAWFAAVAVNPGNKRKRDRYPATISAQVDAWPELYRSEDILIRAIP